MSYKGTLKGSHGDQRRRPKSLTKGQLAAKKAWATIDAKKKQLLMEIAKKVDAQTDQTLKPVSEEEAERTAKELTDTFYPPMAKPVEEAALWYTYYYLAEVLDDLPSTEKARFKYQFDNLSKTLGDAFMDYGIYSTLRELRHVYGQTLVRIGNEREEELKNWCKQRDIDVEELGVLGYPGEDLAHIGRVVKTKEKFAAFTQQFTALKADETSLLWVFCNPDCDWNPGKNERNARKYLTELRKEGIDYTDKHYLDMAEDIFKNVYWTSGYGGMAWAKICQALKRRDSESPTMWIDTMWAIQHNSGVWINKVYTNETKFGYDDNVYNTLKKLLDANFNGNLKAVGQAAAKYDPSLNAYISKLYGNGNPDWT